MDLGECPYSHEVGLKSDYRREAAKRPYYYEIDVSLSLFPRHLYRLYDI